MLVDSSSTTPVLAAQKSLQDEDIFDVLGAGDIPQEEKDVLMLKMVALVERRAIDSILVDLSDDDAHELELEVDKDEVDPEAIQRFFQNHVPDYEQRFQVEAKKLRRDLIAQVAE